MKIWEQLEHQREVLDYGYKNRQLLEELKRVVGGPAARDLVQRYEGWNLRFCQGLAYGIVFGKHSALEWVRGEEWDPIRTN